MGWDEKLNRYGDRIYYDDTVGVAGTGWPIGTAEHPSNVLADIRAICVRENIHTIVVRGSLILDADMPRYDFVSSGASNRDTFDCAGFDVDWATFYGICVFPPWVGDPYFYQCMVDIYRGSYFNCILLTGILAGHTYLYNCTSFGPIGITIGAFELHAFDCEGNFVLASMNDPSALVEFGGKNSCQIEVDWACSLGTASFYGDYILNDNSVGTVVHDLGIRSKIASYARVPVTVASGNLKNSNDTEKSTIALAYTRIKEIIIGAGLAGVRITFELKTAGGGATATARIYQNGAAVGAVQTDATGGYVTKSEDLTSFAAGDKIQIYAKTSDAAQAAYVQNFRLLYDITDTLVAVSNDP